ncbi:MAG: threonine synthase [Acidobacteriota bacterium]
MRFASTRNPELRVPFLEAAAVNVPPDGGLFLPADLEARPDVDRLLALSWRARAIAILGDLLAPEVSQAEVASLVDASLDFPVPLVAVRPGVFALELFHGPSASFKDFGVRFLAAVLELLRRRGAASSSPAGERLILTATSGDTGAAVARAFWRRPGFRAAVLYPRGGVSALQERQIATLGDNVRAFAVDGTFDDCQRLVKTAFADPELTERLGLTSANSIHVARLLAQVLYYFEAVAEVRRLDPASGPPVVAVPSGNFGNLCAGVLAQRLGLRLSTLVAATNRNRTVPDYLDSGEYRPRPSVPTLSNAMDVGAPNNWERVARLFGDDWQALRQALRWASLDDADTRRAVAELRGYGYAGDPHGAVAYGALCRTVQAGEIGVFLATAHPAKFNLELGTAVPLPAALRELETRPLRVEPLASDFDALRRLLEAWPRSSR